MEYLHLYSRLRLSSQPHLLSSWLEEQDVLGGMDVIVTGQNTLNLSLPATLGREILTLGGKVRRCLQEVRSMWAHYPCCYLGAASC